MTPTCYGYCWRLTATDHADCETNAQWQHEKMRGIEIRADGGAISRGRCKAIQPCGQCVWVPIMTRIGVRGVLRPYPCGKGKGFCRVHKDTQPAKTPNPSQGGYAESYPPHPWETLPVRVSCEGLTRGDRGPTRGIPLVSRLHASSSSISQLMCTRHRCSSLARPTEQGSLFPPPSVSLTIEKRSRAC